jgi:hypothetical protein
MWYHHDRAAAHFACEFQKHLTGIYNTRWIGQEWPVMWPARSPGLTPFYFFLWYYIKTLNYSLQIIMKRILLCHIVEAAETWHV